MIETKNGITKSVKATSFARPGGVTQNLYRQPAGFISTKAVAQLLVTRMALPCPSGGIISSVTSQFRRMEPFKIVLIQPYVP
mmetsp:Transcript_12495/g.22646  ORF Transcript_12495/g.22646 Transcript_12495/m.22646 type:complete len:82 (-) Transcript_12495:3799-4044(-)